MPKGKPNKRYTPEFKKLVVEAMIEEKLSDALNFLICKQQLGSGYTWRKDQMDSRSNAVVATA